ncbi:MAG: SDR family NAD(P)-dependent oxidoreductase, partial [Myxococcota bacterium]
QRQFKVGYGTRVLVTGAASGLGRALSAACVSRGARVMLADINSTREVSRALGAGASYDVHVDVSQPDSVSEMIDRTVSTLGGIDVVFNNAGVAAAGPLDKSTLEDWEWIRSIDLDGVIYVARAAIPVLKQNSSGWIVNTASLAAFAQAPLMSYYNVCKAGVVALSETLWAELAENNIGVSALCPGFFQTGLVDTFRTTHPGQRKFVEKVMAKSKLTADSVAQMTLRGMERGELYIVPPGVARGTWYLSRFLPRLARRFVAGGPRKKKGVDRPG